MERDMSGPVYFVSGEPQQRGKFMNNTTGTSSICRKDLQAHLHWAIRFFSSSDSVIPKTLFEEGEIGVYVMEEKEGAAQTASVKSPISMLKTIGQMIWN
jgi:hypothetical protein